MPSKFSYFPNYFLNLIKYQPIRHISRSLFILPRSTRKSTQNGLLEMEKSFYLYRTFISAPNLSHSMNKLNRIHQNHHLHVYFPTFTSKRYKHDCNKENHYFDEETSTHPDILSSIKECSNKIGQSVKISGWIDNIRRHKNVIFITLRDGTETVQCVAVPSISNYDQLSTLTEESSLIITGKVQWREKSSVENFGTTEIILDHVQIIGKAPVGGINQVVNEKSNPDHQLRHRHLYLRNERMRKIMKFRSHLLQHFRNFFLEHNFAEVTPPLLVQTNCEDGSEMFKLPYFSQNVYLTQSSQLYLECMLPVLGDVFCIEQSFRAEKSHTRRHLTEFTHIEAEIRIEKLSQLIKFIENMFSVVMDKLMKSECWNTVLSFNPNVIIPNCSFECIEFKNAIELLNKNGVRKPDGSEFDPNHSLSDISEMELVKICGNKPLFIIRYPVEQKPFYMARFKTDPELTESVDLCFPGIGEILGGSVRMWKESDMDEYIVKSGKICPKTASWYLDQFKYGATPHSGFGLGFERFLCYLLGLNHIRDSIPFPRFVDRANP